MTDRPPSPPWNRRSHRALIRKYWQEKLSDPPVWISILKTLAVTITPESIGYQQAHDLPDLANIILHDMQRYPKTVDGLFPFRLAEWVDGRCWNPKMVHEAFDALSHMGYIRKHPAPPAPVQLIQSPLVELLNLPLPRLDDSIPTDTRWN